MNYLKVSIIIVCYNEEKNIKACLESIFSIDYHEDFFEVIIVDGNSSDSTREIVSGFLKKFNNISLVINRKRTIASNRNVGIRKSKFEYILFTDADCIVKANWVKNLVEAYVEHKKIISELAAVGGGNIPLEDSNMFSKCLGQVMNSYLSCMGSVQGKEYLKPKLVDSLACLNVLYEKSKLFENGLFDEVLGNITEDYDLNFRLREKNYKLLYVPFTEVYHNSTSTPKELISKMYEYGKGRGFLMRYKPQTIKFIYMLPIGFILANLFSFLSIVNVIFIIPIFTYFLLITYDCLYAAVKFKNLKSFGVRVIILLSIHYFYSFGEFVGLVRKKA